MNAYSAIIGAGTAAKMLQSQMRKASAAPGELLRAQVDKFTAKDDPDKGRREGFCGRLRRSRLARRAETGVPRK